MFIVYLSLVIVIFSLAYLAFRALKTYKDMKPALKSLNETSVRLQGRMELLKEETAHLTQTQQAITDDIQLKKESVQYTMDSVKAVPASFKQVWYAVKGMNVKNPAVSAKKRSGLK